MPVKTAVADINYPDIFNNLPDMAIIIDPKNYAIMDANKVFLKRESLLKKDIIGKRCYEITHKRSSPCAGPDEVCPLREAVKTHKTAVAEHVHYDKNNNPYYVEIITSFVRDNLNKREFILHISRTGHLMKRLSQQVKDKSKKYLRELKGLVIKDPLTNIYNYRYLMEKLPEELYLAKRYNYPFSLAILDLDYFKSINDAYGHSVGDKVLIEFSQFLKKTLRQSDILSRYGGEEFVILMPHTDRIEAQQAAIRLIEKLAGHIFRISGLTIRLKSSIGIATLSAEQDSDTQDKLLNAADEALQRAKNSGGNMALTHSDLYKDKKETPRKISPYEEVNILKRKIQKLAERVDRVVLESIYAFSKSLEARDYYTAEHAEKMVSIALKVGKEIGLGQDMLNNLERGAMLHDVGKIGISDAILRKKGALTPEEYLIIKLHPKIGAEIIRSIHFLKDVVPIVLHHHEKWDGTGYPSGLKGNEIPLTARIVAICDAYQALISDRPYRKAYSRKEALGILMKEAGVRFDKDLVNILTQLEGNLR
jgi:diguanylate cyclase (GGDEF)-like protein/putative nucleotidyltransferase with HDIG domain